MCVLERERGWAKRVSVSERGSIERYRQRGSERRDCKEQKMERDKYESGRGDRGPERGGGEEGKSRMG